MTKRETTKCTTEEEIKTVELMVWTVPYVQTDILEIKIFKILKLFLCIFTDWQKQIVRN